MPRVFTEAGVAHNVVEVVALRAQGVGAAVGSSGGACVWTLKQIRDELSGNRSLAEIVSSLQDMREGRPVRTVGSAASEFPVIVAVMAVRAQDANTHAARRRAAIEIQHVRSQAGLRERASAIVHHGMARSRDESKLWNHIQRITRCNGPDGRISKL